MKRCSLALATWVLRTFTAGPHADAVAGDLLERLEEGRSMSWFWRQVVSAMVVGACRDARHHPRAILFGVVTGWAFLWLFLGFVAVQIVEIDRLLFATGLVTTYSRWNLWHVVAPWVVFAGGLAQSGWLVTRVSRSTSMTAVVIFALSVTTALACILALDPDSEGAQHGAGLWLVVGFWLVGPSSCIMLGGLLGHRRSRDISHDGLGIASNSRS